MDWKKVIQNEIKNREGCENVDKIPALKTLMACIVAAESSNDERIIRMEGNEITLSVPEVLTSIRIGEEVFSG